MTLAELLDAAYTSEYIELHNLNEIKDFAKIWKNFLPLELEDIKLGIIPQYIITVECLLNDEYKYLIK